MPKVVCISLFRSGTSSFGKYMHQAYGLRLAHNGNINYSSGEGIQLGWDRDRYIAMYQQVKEKEFVLPILQEEGCDGIAVYPASSHFSQIAEANKDIIFIHVRRNKEAWVNSALKHVGNIDAITGDDHELRETIEYFRTAQLGEGYTKARTEAEMRKVLEAAYDAHYARVDQFREQGQARLCELDIEELAKQDPKQMSLLRSFLERYGIEMKVEVPFPNENSHTAHYEEMASRVQHKTTEGEGVEGQGITKK